MMPLFEHLPKPPALPFGRGEGPQGAAGAPVIDVGQRLRKLFS